MKKILVPVDFSAASLTAMETAKTLASVFGAEVTVLHVWETPAYLDGEAVVQKPGEPSQSLVQIALAHARSAMNDLLARADPEGTLRSHSAIEIGTPWRKICEVAKDRDFDLIIMGSHRRGALMRLLLGSVSEHVLTHAHCPTLISRPKPSAHQ